MLAGTRSRLWPIIPFLLGTALAAQPAAPANAPVKIGWFGPLTGESAPWGVPELNTLKLLTEQLNVQGGIEFGGSRHPIELVAYDDKGDTGNAVRMAKKLAAKDHVVAIVGPQGSGEAMPIGSTLNDAKVPCVATTATNPAVTVAPDGTVKPYVFRACFNDIYQGRLAADYAFHRLGKRKAAIFMEGDDPYSQIQTQSFKAAFEQLGGTIAIETGFRWEDKDYKKALGQIRAANPDLVYMPIYLMHLVPASRQARELGLDTVFLGGDGWHNNEGAKVEGNTLDGCLYIDHIDLKHASLRAFREDYEAKYHQPIKLNACLASDAFAMVIDAIRRAGSTRGEDIRKALETTDIQGISGHLRMGPTHDPVGKEAWIMKLSGSEATLQEVYAIPQ